MRKKRIFADGSTYHVTSLSNNKIRVFDNRLGRKIILSILDKAKAKYHFRLINFCIMPTHIHLLIEPAEGTSLAKIMQWIKTNSAKYWNRTHSAVGHLWGNRYFARIIRDQDDFEGIMEYIDQNPVKAGLVANPSDWIASGAFLRKIGA